jgi:phenylpyruvate tautomerase PptA (4-oxalocrotonate tautomerase family)
MPSTLIEICRRLTQQQEVAIMDAVHLALCEAFKIPANDRFVRLSVHEPHRLACPPDRARPDLFTHVSIDAFAGRSLDAKRSLYKAIVGNLAALGIPADHIKIVLRDVPKENWGIRGGQAGCDVELGFNINV